MNKCKYCTKQSEWINPYTGAHMCDEHAFEKLHQLSEEFNLTDMTLKDFFRRDREDDQPEVTFNSNEWSVKDSKIIKK